MLRINLLPPYIYDKQKKVKLAVFWAAIVAAALGAFLFWFVTLNKSLNDQKALQATAEEYRGKFEGVEAKINDEKKHRADIEARQTFIANAQKYNNAWPAALETMRDVTANDILLKSMSFAADRKSVNFTGFAKDEGAIVRWWEYLRNNYAGTDASLPFDNVSFSLPGHPYPPKDSANGGGGGKGGFPGGGGFSGSGGGPTPGGLAGAAGFPGSGGGPSGGFGAPGGRSRGGAGGADAAVGPGLIEGKLGINFAAVVVLKKPLADGIPTPVWNGGGAAAAAPGGFGGGGMPGSGGPPASGGRPSGAPGSSGGNAKD